MARVRTIVMSVAVSCALIAGTGAPVSAAVVPATDLVAEAPPATDEVTDTTTGWRLENDPSQCINSNPRPNCGYKPLDAGERGGALQITLFFVLMGALAVIGSVIIRNVIRRDRAIAERMQAAGDSPGSE